MTTELTTFNGIRNITGAPTTEDWQVRAIKVRNMVIDRGGSSVKYLLSSEIHKFFEYEFNSNKLMLYWFLWTTGVRISEALALRVRDIKFDEISDHNALSYVNVKTAKTKKDEDEYRHIELNDKMVRKLKVYIQTNRLKEHDFLFNVKYLTAFNWIKQTQKRAESDGVTFPIKITPHVFRHSYAMHLYYNGVDQKIISKLLGHKQFKTTEVYTNILAIEAINMRNIEF